MKYLNSHNSYTFQNVSINSNLKIDNIFIFKKFQNLILNILWFTLKFHTLWSVYITIKIPKILIF